MQWARQLGSPRDVEMAIDILAAANKELKAMLKTMRPPKDREAPKENSILKYYPNGSVSSRESKDRLRRIESSLSSKQWPELVEIESLFASPTQFKGLERYSLPAERVVAAASQFESRNANILRIRNIVIADAIDNYINNAGSVRSNLKQALEHLAPETEQRKSLTGWRKSGEWLLQFFQIIPLGAIYMMGKQTSIWGNVIGTGFVKPIATYCRSQSSFVPHAWELTPAACQAIRDWASGCKYDVGPDSSLGELIQKQERTLHSRGPAANSSLNDRAHSHRLSYSPSPPRALLIPNKLFSVIKHYFEDSCRKMRFDENSVLLSSNGSEFRNHLCDDFDSYCFTATMLKDKGLHTEFRRTISSAFALVKPILRVEHPRTLACFFEVIIHLMQTGLPEVAFALCDFIRSMFAEISGTKNIWSQIFQLLNEVDRECLDHVMAQSWRCTTDVFDGVLGPTHPLAVSVRLDYVKRIMVSNSLEEERLLREILARFEGSPGHLTPRIMLNLAHNLNRQQDRHGEAKRVAVEVLSMLQQYDIYAESKVERIDSLKAISRSQFIEGESLEAEGTKRRAIQMIADEWGQQHPWVLEFMNDLEGWLRGWGRKEDADALRGEIDHLMGLYVLEEVI
ncbi:hypothetical protein Q7P37_009808 [Cladosporium fusiforme]